MFGVRVTNPGRSPLDRKLDVYKLESDPPLDTLPFISHTTNNISRDIYIQDSEFCSLFFWVLVFIIYIKIAYNLQSTLSILATMHEV